MTKAQVESEVEKIFEKMGVPERIPGTIIPLVCFEHPSDYYFVVGRDSYTWTEFKKVICRLAHRLNDRGAIPELRTINLRPYFDWLADNNLSNTSVNRACYILQPQKPIDKGDKKCII